MNPGVVSRLVCEHSNFPRGRKPAGSHECFADSQPVRVIESQQRRSRPPIGRQRDNPCIFRTKVIHPALLPRVEKLHDPSRLTIHCGEVRPFVPIAVQTRQRQVFRHRGTAVLRRDNVIDLMREKHIVFMHSAVFAPARRALDDLRAQGR